MLGVRRGWAQTPPASARPVRSRSATRSSGPAPGKCRGGSRGRRRALDRRPARACAFRPFSRPDPPALMHRYRTHTCGQLRPNHVGGDRAPVGLGPSRARPRRAAVHRPARPLRPDPGRRRPDSPAFKRGRDGARRMGDPRRRHGRPRPRTRECATCRPARSRSSRRRSRSCRRPAICRCRSSATSNIRRRRGSTTASSTSAATSCTATS